MRQSILPGIYVQHSTLLDDGAWRPTQYSSLIEMNEGAYFSCIANASWNRASGRRLGEMFSTNLSHMLVS